jgi:hypothetical protein
VQENDFAAAKHPLKAVVPAAADAAAETQAAWLSSRGLGQHAAALQAEGFTDLTELQQMTSVDLEVLCREVRENIPSL